MVNIAPYSTYSPRYIAYYYSIGSALLVLSMQKHIPSGNIIKINNKIKTLEKVTCKDFYWHLLNTDPHTPTDLQKWSIHYPIFNEASANVWPIIFKLPLKQ